MEWNSSDLFFLPIALLSCLCSNATTAVLCRLTSYSLNCITLSETYSRSLVVTSPKCCEWGGIKTTVALASAVITAALRAVFYIARACACNILYLHEGASPRYFRIARRAQRARVLYDNTALKCEDDIVYIHQRALLGIVFMPLILLSLLSFTQLRCNFIAVA